MGFNHQGECIPRESARTVQVNLRISPDERKRWEKECAELKSNPDGKPLDISKFIRGCVEEHFRRKTPIDVRAWRHIKKWWEGQ